MTSAVAQSPSSAAISPSDRSRIHPWAGWTVTRAASAYRSRARSREPRTPAASARTCKVAPGEVVTDRAATYPMVLEELLPAAWHRTEQYANNRVEADHGRLKSRLRPMRGLKQDRSARVVIAG